MTLHASAFSEAAFEQRFLGELARFWGTGDSGELLDQIAEPLRPCFTDTRSPPYQ
jgi:hypothetical protein